MGTTRGERLRIAREKHYKSARLAAKAMGIAVSTYGAHERAEAPGGRDYGPDEAKKYGRRFKVALDCVHGAGSVLLLPLLETLGCEVIALGTEPDGLTRFRS